MFLLSLQCAPSGTVGGSWGGGEGLGEEGVGPGEHGRRSQIADLVWFLHIDNTASRAGRQGTFNPEIVCVYARRSFDLLSALLFDRAEAHGQLRAQRSCLKVSFWRLGDSKRTGGEILSRRERRHKDCVSACFIFALWNIYSQIFFFFPVRTQRCDPLWEIQCELEKLFAARSGVDPVGECS